jgi:hypothetical protein
MAGVIREELRGHIVSVDAEQHGDDDAVRGDGQHKPQHSANHKEACSAENDKSDGLQHFPVSSSKSSKSDFCT